MWSGGKEKGEAYSGVLAQAFLGEMSYRNDILPKKGKHKLESLSACYKS